MDRSIVYSLLPNSYAHDTLAMFSEGMKISTARDASAVCPSRHKGPAGMTTETVSVIGVGVVTISLGVATVSLAWRMNSTLMTSVSLEASEPPTRLRV